LNGLTLYSWVTTAYLLTSTVMVPIWGKLGDLYGRKPVLLASIGLFLLGSWLAGLSGQFGALPVVGGGMTQLIVFRALQGLGGGGLFTTAFAIIGDIYPPRERAKLGGVFGAVFGLSSAIGPLVGGYFTDHGTTHIFGQTVAGWRWVFYLNLPLSLLSLFMILAKMPKMSHQAKGRIDFIGAALIVGAAVPLLLALTLGGHDHPWRSPLILGLFGAAASGVVLYIIAERFAQDPILPLDLFRNRVFTMASLATFLVSMAFMSTVAFLPLFMQLGQGVAATTSGLASLPLMAGLIVSSTLSGRLASRMGRYKALILGGIVVTFVGTYLLSQMRLETSRLDLGVRMAILGIGLGPSQSLFSLAIQAALPREKLGVATSSNQFFRQIGSTIGVALFGTALTNNLNTGLSRVLPGVDANRLQHLGAASRGGGAPVLPDSVREIIVAAITHTFALGLVVLAIALVVTLFVPQVSLDDHQGIRRSPGSAEADEMADAASPIVS
jgi:EmrB/QacA subfamily drug resistance transporter